MPLDSKEIAFLIGKWLNDKKADDVIILDIRDLTIIADRFVICSARSAVQVRALVDYIQEKINEYHIPLCRLEGYKEGKWVVMDCGDVIIHIFRQEEREFYNLERLWTEGDNLYAASRD